MNNEIGASIVKYRKINGMSQKFLAKELGLSSQGLLKIEKGIVNPRSNTVAKICEILCITPNQLFGIEQIEEKNISIIERLRRIEA
jgi:Predicted transcriptional regulators